MVIESVVCINFPIIIHNDFCISQVQVKANVTFSDDELDELRERLKETTNTPTEVVNEKTGAMS